MGFKNKIVFFAISTITILMSNAAQAGLINISGSVWADSVSINVTAQSGMRLQDTFSTVRNYVDQLNATQYGGASDWRLPSAYEVAARFSNAPNLGGDGWHWGTRVGDHYWNNLTIFAYGGSNWRAQTYASSLGCACYDWIPGESSGQSFHVTAVRYVPVPEPDLAYFFIVGLVGFAFVRLKSKAAEIVSIS